jgi:hypothetical protein
MSAIEFDHQEAPQGDEQAQAQEAAQEGTLEAAAQVAVRQGTHPRVP